MAAMLLVALQGCGCDELVRVHTGLAFTPDGEAVVVEAIDGLYVAAPIFAPPRQIADRHCGGGLRCVRISPDGTRLAALFAQGEGALFDLHEIALGQDEETASSVVATDALDAGFSPDGRELYWASPSAVEGAVRLWRKGPAGPQELLAALSLAGGDSERALNAAVLTGHGVAYVRVRRGEAELWFTPFEEDGFRIGTVASSCAGTLLRQCVAVSADGATLAWQDRPSGVVTLFRAASKVVLPLGRGYGFAFTRTGSYALRMDPSAAVVQSVESAAVARRAEGATAAELSADGETLVWLVPESKADQSVRLFSGPSRRSGADRDHDVFAVPRVRPLRAGWIGDAEVDVALTGDARWAVVAERSEAPDAARLWAVGLSSGERVALGEARCASCCFVAPQGALLVCLPGDGAGAKAVELIDPASGREVSAAGRFFWAEPLFDGSAVVALDRSGAEPKLVALNKDGRVLDMGNAAFFAVSPTGPWVAGISSRGGFFVHLVP